MKNRRFRKFRRLTAWMRKLPDFVIIGAQRCGTTSLYSYLAQHPFVASVYRKEVHFFDLNYHKGLFWYRAHFPTVLTAYLFQRKHGRPLVSGEATPYYLFHPHAARRLRQHLPDAKLIVLLRNPVDRAFSHYRHEIRLGVETLPFEGAIKREADRIEEEILKMQKDEHYYSFHHHHYAYLRRGIYVEQLRAWMEFFPRERFLILKSEDLFSNPSAVIRQVLRYLDLPAWEPRTFEKMNSTDHQTDDPKIRAYLADYFEEHNKKLYDFLGIDFNWS